MSAQPRELRVLDGVHAGARARLQARLSIGSALDNDIVLSDPGIGANHAELVWDDVADRWWLQRDGGERPTEHGLGEAVRLGPVRLTVAASNEPFDAVVVVPERIHEETPEAAPDATPDAEAEAQTDAGPAVAPARAPQRSLAMSLVITLVSLLLVLLVAGVATLWWGLPPAPASKQPAAAVSAPAASPLAPVQRVIDTLGLQDRLKVVAGPGGLPRVEGLLDDEALVESLGSALSRLQPRPGMRVWSPVSLRLALREAGVVLPPRLSLRISPQGAAVLSGPVAGPEAAQALKAQLRALLPASVPWVDELRLPAQLAERFLADARAQGFALNGQLSGEQLRLTGRIAAADLARWERWLLEASRRHAGVLRFVVVLEPEPTRAAVAARSPLAVLSVVGGSEPMLVLADGTRLLVGGRHEGWRLLAIDDRTIVFEGRGRTVTVSR